MAAATSPQVVVHVVTFNNESTILPCLAAAFEQTGFSKASDIQVVLTDNASSDSTLSQVKEHFDPSVILHENSRNLGFSAAHNQGISYALEQSAKYVLILNPDLVLAPDTLSRLVQSIEEDSIAGAATPKLLRCDAALQPFSPPQVDSTGIYFTPALRHFDRGAEKIYCGQFDTPSYVIGGTGACLLLKTSCILDVALARDEVYTELFDDSFFAYREDAELAWRCTRLGWKTRYEPEAVAYHVRRVTPERRKSLPNEINAWSVRNRFLLQWLHFRPLEMLHCLLPTIWRNLLVLGAAATIEQSSFQGIKEALQLLPNSLKKRRWINQHARISAAQERAYFQSPAYAEKTLSTPQPSSLSSVHVIIINYNSGHRLKDCVRSLLEAAQELDAKVRVEVSILDNHSKDGSTESLTEELKNSKHASLVELSSNLGFAGAINHGASSSEADALLILNPDIQIEADAISELLNSLGQYPELGAVAPVLCSPDGSIQHGFLARNFPTLGSTLAELFFLHRLWPRNPWTARYHLREQAQLTDYFEQKTLSSKLPHHSPKRPVVVEQPAGASLMIRRSAFEELAGFDEGFWPAWFEDVDFCKRLNERGYLAAICASARVVHEGGYSLESLPRSRFLEIWYENLKKYWRKHGSRMEYLSLRLALPLALFLRAILSLLSSTSTDEAPQRSFKVLLRQAWR